jgi:predicted DsbA family dithiol-disulfide isomerase
MDLDTEAFNACLDSEKYVSIVDNQTSFSQSIGVSSTPSFIVNGQPIIGAQDYSVFEQYIEAELAKAGEK